MKSLLLIFVIISFSTAEDVLELGDDDFTITLKRHETTLVMFYAPWCGFCQRLDPEYSQAAEMIKDDEPPIKLAKIDCTEAGREICNKYSIKSYPTLKIFRQAELFKDYKGPRKAAAIAKYMRVQVRPMMSRKSVPQYLDSSSQDMTFNDIDSKLVKLMLKNRFNGAYFY